jgi:uncharacterized membrane protein YqiK
MKSKIIFSIFAVAILFFLLEVVPCVKADVFIQSKRHTDSFTMMGRTTPAKDVIITSWISKDKFRSDEGDEQSMIVRLDKNKLYVINHTEKTYSIVDLPIDFEKLIPPEAKPMMQQMMQMLKMTVTVQDTGETKNIKGFNCKKYLVNMRGGMMSMNLEVWTTKDIKIDYDTYAKFSECIMGINPMFKDITDEMKKIEGFTVYSAGTMSMMGTDVKTTEELMEVSEKSAPAGLYDIPSGYTEKAYNPMERKR